MKLQEMVDKVLNPLSSLKDDTNDAINTTPYILRRLSEFTDGELEGLISELEEIREKAEEMEDELEELKETVRDLEEDEIENAPLQRVESETY